MNKKFIFSLLVVTVVSLFLYLSRFPAQEGISDESLISYRSLEYGVSFSYPPGLYLKEFTDVGTPEQPQLAVVLVENTQINRDIIDGKSIEGGEGPIAIALDVYQNPGQLSSEEWAKQDTNWEIGSKNLTPVTVNGQSGFSFNWDGLYQGKSVVVAKDSLAYVFSVTWLTPEDQLIKDFDIVLSSVVFGK